MNYHDLIELNPNEKQVYLDLKQSNNIIYLKIYDSAGGVPEDIITKVFEPYFTTKHQSQGTGIGLYMSNQIITKHFTGTLKVTNEHFKIENNEYYGACFHITIPTGLETW